MKVEDLWKDQDTIDKEFEEGITKEKEILALREEMEKRFRGKPFKNLKTPDKDFLLEGIAKIMGIID